MLLKNTREWGKQLMPKNNACKITKGYELAMN